MCASNVGTIWRRTENLKILREREGSGVADFGGTATFWEKTPVGEAFPYLKRHADKRS
jgi:hypothetical protein